MRIGKAHFTEMVEHCCEDYSREACGILAGKNNLVTKVYKMTNTADTPATCYYMDPREQFKVFKEMRSSWIEMLAIYHSHTGSPAYPSPRDREMAFYPEASYVIVSLENRKAVEVKAFKIKEDKIEEEKIEE